MTRRRGHVVYQYKHGALSHPSILYIISEYQLCIFIAIRLRVVRRQPLANIPSACQNFGSQLLPVCFAARSFAWASIFLLPCSRELTLVSKFPSISLDLRSAMFSMRKAKEKGQKYLPALRNSAMQPVV